MIPPQRIAAASDLPPGARKCLEVAGRQITLLNVDGTLHALENNCPHRGGPVGEGEVERGVITCPWHGWSFDLATGQGTENRAAVIPVFPCRIEGSDLVIEIE